MQAIEMYIPTKYISNITKPPWIISDVDRLIRKKQQLYNKAKKSKAAADWIVYKKSNIKCVSLFECNLTNMLLVLSIPQTSRMLINNFSTISSPTNQIMLEFVYSKPQLELLPLLVQGKCFKLRNLSQFY